MSTRETTTSQTLSAEDRSARIAVTLFPVLILVGAAVAFAAPDTFTPLGEIINPLLGIIMFGMGLTLTLPDFKLVATRPLPVLLGVLAQYAVMPLLGLGIALALQLPADLAAGVILVGCAPGGTSSNVVTYLAKGDTALSVAMTSVSTLLAPLLTPILTLWLAGQYLPVDGAGMALSILQIVLLPVAAGLLVRLFLPRLVTRALPALPWISVTAITLVVVAVVSGSADSIVDAGLLVLLAVVLHNGLGYAIGYTFGKLTGQPERVRPHDVGRGRHAELRPRRRPRGAVLQPARGPSRRGVLGVAQRLGSGARGVPPPPPGRRDRQLT